MEEMLQKIYQLGMLYGIRIIAAILIFIIGKWAARLISKLVAKVMEKSKVDAILIPFIKNLTYFVLLTFVVIASLNKLGVETTSFVAIIGAAGLAIGFALQGALANFAAGVMLIVFKPFKVDDYVEAGSTAGFVEQIQIFNTILRSPDNRKIIVPNSKITGDKITNYSDIDKRRVDLVFGISYDDDIRKAKNILEKVVTSDSRVLKDPKPVIAVAELADSSVNLVCRPWVKPADYWGVYFDILEAAKEELEKNQITIPYPQRDIHLFETKKTG